MTFATDFVLDESFLVFVACWGSGKTLLMITKAKKLNASGEKVLILIFLNGKEIGEGQKSLLILDLEEKLKEYQNITVKGVRYIEWIKDGLRFYSMKDIDGNDLSTDEYDHIFVDEYFEDLIRLNKESIKKFKELIKGKKTVWVSLSNSYNKPTVPEIGSDPSE
jgi:hypothetical protein